MFGIIVFLFLSFYYAYGFKYFLAQREDLLSDQVQILTSTPTWDSNQRLPDSTLAPPATVSLIFIGDIMEFIGERS